jgi:hypothetical protein
MHTASLQRHCRLLLLRNHLPTHTTSIAISSRLAKTSCSWCADAHDVACLQRHSGFAPQVDHAAVCTQQQVLALLTRLAPKEAEGRHSTPL